MFCDIIGSSVVLQYRIECFIAEVSDGMDRGVAVKHRLDSLRKWREACRTLQWTSRLEVPFDHVEPPFRMGNYGSVYCVLRGQEVSVYQPPSKLRGVTEREWVVKNLGLPRAPEEFTYDHENQLLVVVTFE